MPNQFHSRYWSADMDEQAANAPERAPKQWCMRIIETDRVCGKIRPCPKHDEAAPSPCESQQEPAPPKTARELLVMIKELGRVTMASEDGREIILAAIDEVLSASSSPSPSAPPNERSAEIVGPILRKIYGKTVEIGHYRVGIYCYNAGLADGWRLRQSEIETEASAPQTEPSDRAPLEFRKFVNRFYEAFPGYASKQAEAMAWEAWQAGREQMAAEVRKQPSEEQKL